MPGYSKHLHITSVTAVGALGIYDAVAADRTQAAPGAFAVGFAQTSAPAGGSVAVAISGSSLARASGPVGVFDGVEVGAGGSVVKLGNGIRVGTALTDGDAGDYIEVLIQPPANSVDAALLSALSPSVTSAVWRPLPPGALLRLMIGGGAGGGTYAYSLRNAALVETSEPPAAIAAGASETSAIYVDDAIEIKVTLTGTATAEIR